MDNDNDTVESQQGFSSIPLLKSVRAVKIAQFLPRHERDALYTTVCSNQAAFQRPGNSGPDVEGSCYLSLDSSGCDHPGAAPVRAACELLANRILEILPTLFIVLDIEPFAVAEMPLTLVNGLDGHYGLPHADSIDGRYRISLLYYFHREPRAFRGGDLEFYAANAASPNVNSDEALARIDQEDNLLIAFPSQMFHGITKVRCDSDDFADGRFAVVSFLGN